jgi:hypothetical protein
MSIKKVLIIFSLLSLLGITGICMAEGQPGPPPGPPNMDAQLRSGLDKLVEDQVITPKQEQFLMKYFHDMRDNGPAAQPTDNRPQNYHNLLGALIKSGDVTPNQARAIEDILSKPPMPRN